MARHIASGKSSFDFVDQDALFEFLETDRNAVFLDLGCGAGRYSLALAERLGDRGTIHAFDLWEDGINSLREQATAANLTSIRPMVADITAPLPLDSDLADACLIATILHGLKPGPRDVTLSEAARILKPGGTLVIVEFKRMDHSPGPPLSMRLSGEEITAMTAGHGFTPAQTHSGSSYVDIFRFNAK